MAFDEDAEVVSTLRALSDQWLQSYIVAAYDLERRTTGVFRSRWHDLLVLACEERDERRRANDSMLDATFPVIDLGEVPLSWRERALDWWHLVRPWIRPRWMPNRRV